MTSSFLKEPARTLAGHRSSEMHVSPHWACLAALPACSTQWGHSGPLPTGSAARGSPARSQPAAGHRPGPHLLPLPLGAVPGLCVTPTPSLPNSDQTTAVLGPHRGLSSPKGTALGQLGTGLSLWPSVQQTQQLCDACSPNAQLSFCKAHSWCLAMPLGQNPRPSSCIPGP